jgi:NitT/TauT family transport system substrate-binding protein
MRWTHNVRRASPACSLGLVLLLACAPAAAPGPTTSAPAPGPGAAAPAAAPGPTTSAPAPGPGAAPSAAGAAGAAAPPAAPPREPVKLIQSVASLDIGYLPPFVAASKGFLAEEGLDVEIVQMNSNAAIPAITNKQVHLAAGGSGTRAAYQGAPLRGIFYYFNQLTWLAVGAPEVKAYRDLAGKTIAIAGPGSTEDWVSKLILRRENIPLSDVQIVALGQGPQRAQALLAGQVHFSILNGDLAVGLERRGFNVLGPTGDLLPIPFTGFVAHADTIREQPDLLKAWMRASIRALQFLKRNPAEAADIAAREIGIEPDIAQRATELMLPAISDDDPGGFTEAALLLLTQTDMASLELAADPAELGKRVTDLTLLRQAQRDLGIRCTQGYQCQ